MSLVAAPPELSPADKAKISEFSETADRIRKELAKKIVALDDVVEQLLICLLAGSHALLTSQPQQSWEIQRHRARTGSGFSNPVSFY